MSFDPSRPQLPVREPAPGSQPNGRIPFPATTRSSVYFGQTVADEEGMDEPATSDRRLLPGVAADPFGVEGPGGTAADDDLFEKALGGGRPPGSFDGGDDGGGGDDDDDDLELRSDATRNALEWAVVLVGAVLVALVLRAALFQAFWIPSESMETTLLINDRVLVNKLSYKLHDVHRGDVVVFVRRDDEPGEYRDLIKRVIGLPGDTVESRDNVVYVNGSKMVEPYLDPGITTSNFGPVVVPEDQIFVMGDNRNESFDSRNFGTIEEDRIVGRAFVLFWPVNRIGWL
ncbi:MAG: signal peptidase I [Acidimicrobiales bacterium]